MKSLPWAALLLAMLYPGAWAQEGPQQVRRADDRYKTDILIVVAHPDDEAFFTPYAAKAIYDMHKTVAVIFTTHGTSGLNHFSREHGPAMAEEREIEARQACAQLKIDHVWFLDGKDTRSQDPLISLSNWGHGENLEKLVGLIRLIRPEIILTHLPGMFIGENHGDHQATGVLVSEAFDLAANPAVFPSQLAGESPRTYLSNLQPWQPKKIYFGSDANNQKQFEGTGPTYSPVEVSPSQHKPYWLLALRAATSHRTQSGDDLQNLSRMSDEELEKMMQDPKNQWWSDRETLIFGKSAVGGKPTDEVFSHVDEKPQLDLPDAAAISCGHRGHAVEEGGPRVELGGPWHFYTEFYPAHGFCQLPVAKVPEIGIEPGAKLIVPLVLQHDPSKPLTITVNAKVPDNWKVTEGTGQIALPAEESTSLLVSITTPNLSPDELKKAGRQDIQVTAEADAKPIGEVTLHVALRPSALPQF
jgi:LmbE family N-acetylglucosaminyl deacetylase